MIIDVHLHIAACIPGHGNMSEKLLSSLPFRFMSRKFGLHGNTPETETNLLAKLVQTFDDTKPLLDRVVVLAFDGVHDKDGNFDKNNTHLYVTNDYVIELCQRYPDKFLFGASVHPYRKDAVQELERCAQAGAVLIKWLPPTQNFNPADERCIPFYEALAHLKIPLLSHTGAENSLPVLDNSTTDPKLLIPALKRGVTVIAAHCATRLKPWETNFVPDFVRMAQNYEHLYGDTSALNLPMRWAGYTAIFKNKHVREKVVHGSDWPIYPVPPPLRSFGHFWKMMFELNWLKRDVLIKKKLDFDDAYWHRAAKILRLPG